MSKLPPEVLIFGLILLGAAGVELLINIDTCSYIAAEAVSTRKAASCWEFWLERYQTLAGAFVAVLAAGTAWIVARQSINRLDRSIDVARQQSAVSAIEHLQIRKRGIDALQTDMLVAENQRFTEIFERGREFFSVIRPFQYRSDLLPRDHIFVTQSLEMFFSEYSIGLGERIAGIQEKLRATPMTAVTTAAIGDYRRECETIRRSADQIAKLWQTSNSGLATEDECYLYIARANDLCSEAIQMLTDRTSFYAAINMLGQEYKRIDAFIDINLSIVESRA